MIGSLAQAPALSRGWLLGRKPYAEVALTPGLTTLKQSP